MKWPNMKTIVLLLTLEATSASARPQPTEVRRRKKDRRGVKEGSGRCHVFLVCFCAHISSGRAGRQRATDVVVYRAKHLLRRYKQARHLPDGHLEVHLRE